MSLAAVTGESRFDAVGSVAIGRLLGVIAVTLGIEMRSLLIGEVASQAEVAAIGAAPIDGPAVRRLIHLRTLHLFFVADGVRLRWVGGILGVPTAAGVGGVRRTTWFRTLWWAGCWQPPPRGGSIGRAAAHDRFRGRFQIIDADGELKAHIDTLLRRPWRLLILRRGRRAPGELPRSARNLPRLPGVDSQVVMGG